MQCTVQLKLSCMCLSAVIRSNKLSLLTIDDLIGVQRSAAVRCADFLFVVAYIQCPPPCGR